MSRVSRRSWGRSRGSRKLCFTGQQTVNLSRRPLCCVVLIYFCMHIGDVSMQSVACLLCRLPRTNCSCSWSGFSTSSNSPKLSNSLVNLFALFPFAFLSFSLRFRFASFLHKHTRCSNLSRVSLSLGLASQRKFRRTKRAQRRQSCYDIDGARGLFAPAHSGKPNLI